MGVAAQYGPGEQLAGTVYRVVRHLATGGMGSVYDVEDVTVGKRYVLKTLHPQLVAREDLARRMQAEARTLAQLQHPNIVDVVTAGVTTDELRMPFYVMERLNGQNLRVVLDKKGSLELPHCCRIAIDVADALEHAHENAVIHRDVKPENIFLHRNTNGTTTTKLLDFGIMRLLDRRASHTQGKFIGTLRYASPEQIMGGDLGPATDIYSLGIVLYEMLCGRGPFDQIGDAYAIGAAHAQLPPPPVSRFAPGVPAAAERLVMAALAKDPAARPRDCFTFAAELRRILREAEQAPRTATAVNVLSAVPDTRPVGAGAFTGTEASPAPAAGATAGATIPGMMPPTMQPPTLASGDLGTAPTVASDPGDPAPAAIVRSSPGGVVTPPMYAAPAAAAHVGPRPIDRDAATRASAPTPQTRRLAQHGTQMDDALGLMPDDAVRAALAEPGPLEVPPSHGNGSAELVFPNARAHPTGGTGPVAAEARTRPPERSVVAPLATAIVIAVLLVGGAVVAVKRPWGHANASAAPAASSVAATAATAGSTSAPAAAVASASASPAPSAAPTSAVAASAVASEPAPAASPSAPPSAAAPSRGGGHRSHAAPKPEPVPATGAPAAPAAPPAGPAQTPKKAGAQAPPRPEDVPF